MADSEDIVMLGLGGRREEVDDEGDDDDEVRDKRFAYGASGTGLSEEPEESFDGRLVDPVFEMP